MPATIFIRRASECSLEEITLALKNGFEDYAFPFTRAPAQQAERMALDDVVLEGSFVAFSDAGPVGAVLLGVRGQRGWCSDLALAQGYRGQGVGRVLMEHQIAEARVRKLAQLQLEVLTNNVPALQLYQSLGFKIERELTDYSGPLQYGVEAHAFSGVLVPDFEADAAEESVGRAPVAFDPAAVTRYYDEYHLAQPSWELERPLLERLIAAGKSRALAVPGDAGDAPNAYLLYSEQEAQLDLLAFGARPGADVTGGLELATGLLNALAGQHPQTRFFALNVPPGDPLGPILENAGCPVAAKTFEMLLTL
ncbi:MAG TPA: GNAT family N-acetyltransferase [Ktedonobacterales bacterium]|jgi:GNAT superfamily N-acetyltransferase